MLLQGGGMKVFHAITGPFVERQAQSSSCRPLGCGVDEVGGRPRMRSRLRMGWPRDGEVAELRCGVGAADGGRSSGRWLCASTQQASQAPLWVRNSSGIVWTGQRLRM